jgi:hypothetical protein
MLRSPFVTNLAIVVAFIAAIFLTAHPALDGPFRFLGRLVVVLGIPALVAWKLDPDGILSLPWDTLKPNRPKDPPRP